MIKLLDCTLRDGAYINGSQFGDETIRGIISKLTEAKAEIIECGWLKDAPRKEGSSYFHTPEEVAPFITPSDRLYSVMIDWDRYDVDSMPEYSGVGANAVRVVFPRGKCREGATVAKKVKDKGYTVMLQAANTLAYSNEDLEELIEVVNELKPASISVVDTFGAMYKEDLLHICQYLDNGLDKGISIGFHSHNNQQLSFALSIDFIEYFKNKRDIIVDASLCGMGRGAGNTTTELIVSYLNNKCHCHYDLDAVMDAIDIYMEYFKNHYTWGYSTPYFLAGLYCTHVNNIAYLLTNHRASSRDIRNVLGSMLPEDRRKYDYDKLEKTYIDMVNRKIDDELAINDIRGRFANKDILLVAPGTSSGTHIGEINDYIRQNDPVVIGVNAILRGYKYDYLFFTNSARYEYARITAPATFEQTPKICLSNVHTKEGDNVITVAYDKTIKRGYRFYDNAMISALRLVDRLGYESVHVAGFDGFKENVTESYADLKLPALNNGVKADELNAEIGEMYADFTTEAKNCNKIVFLTPSIYEEGTRKA